MAKKPTSDYLKAAKAGRQLVPSLAKYRRRKTLNRWEKAAITRAANKVAKASRGRALHPLSKAEAKRINPAFVIGDGIRAMPIRAAELSNARVKVERDGNVTVQREMGGRKRRWHYVYLPPDIFAIADALLAIQDKLRRNEVANVHVLTAAGIEGMGNTLTKDQAISPFDAEEMTDHEDEDTDGAGSTLAHFNQFIGKYSSLDPTFEDWFLGLAYFVQKI